MPRKPVKLDNPSDHRFCHYYPVDLCWCIWLLHQPFFIEVLYFMFLKVCSASTLKSSRGLCVHVWVCSSVIWPAGGSVWQQNCLSSFLLKPLYSYNQCEIILCQHLHCFKCSYSYFDVVIRYSVTCVNLCLQKKMIVKDSCFHFHFQRFIDGLRLDRKKERDINTSHLRYAGCSREVNLECKIQTM